MISNDVNATPGTDDQKPKELESFLIDQSAQQNQPTPQTINIIDSKLLSTNQLNPQSQVQQIITSNSNSNNLPFIIQNGNIYQLTTTNGNQINSSNLIQISGDNLKTTNPIKLTTIKNANVLNLNTVNKSRIIVKTNPNDLTQGQQIITTISPNSLNAQKLNQQNQLKAINLMLQNSNQPKQLIITNQQNKPQISSQNGSPIIVLTPSNRTLNDQNLQLLLQQKNQNAQSNTLPVISQPQQTIQQVKTSTLQQKIYVPQTGNVNLIKKNVSQINENELKTVEMKNSNPNLISLLNSNSNEIKQEPVVNNQPKIVYTKQQKEIANITPIASSKTVQNIPPQNTVQVVQTEAAKEEINEDILNECILPDTRIFASLLNKDHSLPNNNPNPTQKNEIKYKTVLIGNTEHVILDNLQNLSDFKGNFSELKNLACSVADHLNKSVSIPAFLLIDSKSSAEKIKSILGDININPIIIDTLTQNSQQNEVKQSVPDPNSDREKFNQHHQTLIKKLSSTQPEITSPINTDLMAKQKKITTPKRRAPKPKKTQIILNSNGLPQINKSKLTINDLIQQNAMNQSLEMEKSSEPTAKKIKTINQLVSVEQKLAQPLVNVQSVQQLPSIQQIPMQQEPPKLQTQQSNDWLDQQIQIANEFIDTLTKNDENEKMIKNESMDLIKNEPSVHMQNLVDVDQQNANGNMQMLSNDYNFEIDPFDTNLYFSSNLNDIEF